MRSTKTTREFNSTGGFVDRLNFFVCKPGGAIDKPTHAHTPTHTHTHCIMTHIIGGEVKFNTMVVSIRELHFIFFV